MSTKKTSTELVVTSKVQPKPTRAEIIDAMARIEVGRRNDAMANGVKRRKVLEEEARAYLVNHLLKNIGRIEGYGKLGYVRKDKEEWRVYGAEVEFSINNPPKEYVAMLREIEGLPSTYRDANFSEVRKEILAASNGLSYGERVTRLLDDKETRKSLETMLDSISK